MMKIIYLFIFNLTLTSFLFSQNNLEPYFIHTKGAKLKIGHYNLRSIPQSYTVYTLSKVFIQNEKTFLDIKVDNLDRHQNFISSQNFLAEMSDEGIIFDKTFIINIDTLANINKNDYVINGRDLLIPNYFGAGMNLLSGWVEFVKNDEVKYKVSEFSRVIDSHETIKTKIGDFETWLVFSKHEANYYNNDMLNVYTYYVKGIGPVRTNYYNAKRKLVRFSEIVEYETPENS